MSNADTRQAIADALSTVAGIHGYPARPDVPSDGDGWPQWRGGARAGGQAFYHTWAVLVVVPGDEIMADEYADTHGQLIADALAERDVLFVDSIEPAKIESEGGDLLALLLTGRSE